MTKTSFSPFAKYYGLNRKPTFDELVYKIHNEDPFWPAKNLKYPDRSATVVRNSLEYQNLINNVLGGVSESQNEIAEIQANEHNLSNVAKETGRSIRETRIIDKAIKTPVAPSSPSDTDIAMENVAPVGGSSSSSGPIRDMLSQTRAQNIRLIEELRMNQIREATMKLQHERELQRQAVQANLQETARASKEEALLREIAALKQEGQAPMELEDAQRMEVDQVSRRRKPEPNDGDIPKK